MATIQAELTISHVITLTGFLQIKAAVGGGVGELPAGGDPAVGGIPNAEPAGTTGGAT